MVPAVASRPVCIYLTGQPPPAIADRHGDYGRWFSRLVEDGGGGPGGFEEEPPLAARQQQAVARGVADLHP